jgi:hypothetical protein
MKAKNSKKSRINIRVVVYSILALGFVALTLLFNWMFVIGALVLSWLSQRELMKK